MSFPVEQIRAEFPILADKRRKKPFRYFDSACVTLRPGAVVDAIREYYESFPGCHGRTVHSLGREVTQHYERAHAAAADLIGARGRDGVVFVRNATEGINAVYRGLEFQPDDVVYTSDIEHNSNLLPWQIGASQHRFQFRIFKTNEDSTFDEEAFVSGFPARCRLVAVHSASNVTGTSFPLKRIVDEAHARGALVSLATETQRAQRRRKINHEGHEDHERKNLGLAQGRDLRVFPSRKSPSSLVLFVFFVVIYRVLCGLRDLGGEIFVVAPRKINHEGHEDHEGRNLGLAQGRDLPGFFPTGSYRRPSRPSCSSWLSTVLSAVSAISAVRS